MGREEEKGKRKSKGRRKGQRDGRWKEAERYSDFISVFCGIHLFVSAHKLSTVFKSLLPFNIFLLYPFKVNFLK